MEGNSYGRWRLDLLKEVSRQCFRGRCWRGGQVEVRLRGELAQVLALLGHPLAGRQRRSDVRRAWLHALGSLADDNELSIRRATAPGQRRPMQRLIVGALLELAGM